MGNCSAIQLCLNYRYVNGGEAEITIGVSEFRDERIARPCNVLEAGSNCWQNFKEVF
jgi:hypothetical protein